MTNQSRAKGYKGRKASYPSYSARRKKSPSDTPNGILGANPGPPPPPETSAYEINSLMKKAMRGDMDAAREFFKLLTKPKSGNRE